MRPLFKAFLIVLLVFLGIFIFHLPILAEEKCEAMVHGDEDCEGSWGDEKCSTLEEVCDAGNKCCSPGTICEDIGGGKKMCIGGLFTKGQSAKCLAKGNCDRCDMLILVKNGFQFLVQIAGALAVLSLVIVGIMYMVSAGAFAPTRFAVTPAGLDAAKKALTSVIVGLVIVLFAWTMINWLMHFLGYKEAVGHAWWSIQCGEEVEYVCHCSNPGDVYKDSFTLSECQDKCTTNTGDLCEGYNTAECEPK